MSGAFLLDWATMAVSLFNTILFLWLGLMVLLNAERRTGGVWLAGGGMLLDGFFFICHTVILGLGLERLGTGIALWWHLGWIPVILSPLIWYLIMLWYAGYWDSRGSSLFRRHRPWLILLSATAGVLLTLLLIAPPLASITQVTQLNFNVTPSWRGIPILVFIYPFYSLACIFLWIDALLRPAQSTRLREKLARSHARRWLIIDSIVILIIVALVGFVMAWVVITQNRITITRQVASDLGLMIALFDLTISTLIGLALVLLGRAVVAFEVFTGKTLPRGAFVRHWTNVIILAAGYGLVVGWSLALQLDAIFAVLLTAILLALFYALSNWRAYQRREQFITQLRPFVSGQSIVDQLLTKDKSTTPLIDIDGPFLVLCRDILGTHSAYLAALGPLAPLVGDPLCYPSELAPPDPSTLSSLTDQLETPDTLCLPLEPTLYPDFDWLVPLWGERGLTGALLLGEKEGGGLYTQEEIEIARGSCERFIDTRASTEMARRLMDLQRLRLAQSQVLDQRTRRTIHDDILPQLHTAILQLSQIRGNAGDGVAAEVTGTLTMTHQQLSGLLRELPPASVADVARSGLIDTLKQMIDVEFTRAFDHIEWYVDDRAQGIAGSLPGFTAEVLYFAAREAVRNAARHGRGKNTGQALNLYMGISGSEHALTIVVRDNGVGMAANPQSRGQGLSLHSTMMAVVGGILEVSSSVGHGTTVTLTCPV